MEIYISLYILVQPLYNLHVLDSHWESVTMINIANDAVYDSCDFTEVSTPEFNNKAATASATGVHTYRLKQHVPHSVHFITLNIDILLINVSFNNVY